jgi:hypothetical protein
MAVSLERLPEFLSGAERYLGRGFQLVQVVGWANAVCALDNRIDRSADAFQICQPSLADPSFYIIRVEPVEDVPALCERSNLLNRSQVTPGTGPFALRFGRQPWLKP